MKIDDPLGMELMRLARKLELYEIRLIVGGGYGLLLKTKLSIETKLRTRIDPFPAARSTDDLDFFLQAEIVASGENFRTIQSILDDDYEPISNAKYYQFRKKEMIFGLSRPVKVDILAAPPESPELIEVTDIDSRRIKPKGQETKLHARRCDEAVFVERTAIQIALTDSDGIVDVFVPHPFAYLFLKLNALADSIAEPRKEGKAPNHAFDIYRILAMMTEPEWNEAVKFAQREGEHQQFKKAAEIVSRLFADDNSEGTRLIKSYAKGREPHEPNIVAVIEDLTEIFLGK